MLLNVSIHNSWIHDSEIIAIRMNGRDILDLDMCGKNDELYSIKLTGLHELRIVGFWLQNVVDIVELVKLEKNTVAKAISEIEEISNKKTSPSKKAFLEDNIENKDFFYFYLIPSNGCAILSICESVEIIATFLEPDSNLI